jgi:serine/threonine protein kinase
VSDGGQPDEIDMVVVGSTGIHVIEVKHWDRSFVRSKRWVVEREADRITQKARRIGTKLRSKRPELRFVCPKMVFTKEPKTLRPETEESVRGVRLYALADWRSLIDLDSLGALPDVAIDHLCDEIAPRSRAVLTGDLRRLGPIADMTLLSAPEDRFHRIYRGRSVINQERLVVHVYDHSASDHPSPEHLARTEFEVVQRLQKSPWLPGLVDSFQEVPNYPGELFFFSVPDCDAPSLQKRTSDPSWLLEQRMEFANQCLIALEQLHSPPAEDVPGVIHRTITPAAILVRPSGEPLFFDWAWAKLPERLTIAVPNTAQSPDVFAAPEVRAGGLALADRRSDIFALCASLLPMFEGDSREDARNVAAILSKGTLDDPGMRPSLSTLAGELEAFGIKKASDLQQIEAIVAPQLWAEGSTVQLDGHSYSVVGKLGIGGSGETFKVVQIDSLTNEEFGTYVAKVVPNPDLGSTALRAYMHARPNTKHANLARVYSTAASWQADGYLALLEWVEGTPIGDYAGVIELYAEDLGENEVEALVLTWINDLCDALATLHAVGLIHGDVSPSNIIVNGSSVTLIDYDLVTRIGQVAAGTGTPPFSSPNLRDRKPVSLSDDLFALGATIFYILAGRDPFIFDGIRAIDRGLAWTADLRQSYPTIARFLDRAVSLDPSKNFADAGAAARFITEISATSTVDDNTPTKEAKPEKPLPLTPNEVPWLKEILKAYPGSRYGNIETRGLDSEFSERTYVETGLDAILCHEIEEGQVRLVILCGNAGDGKTAFLQHLAIQLGLPRFPSSQRLWETKLANGISVKANLDGAAAWQGRSADDLLDEIFAPFHNGVPKERIVHLVAVNDGRLMEWVESYDLRRGPSLLTNQLDDTLGRNWATLDSHVRLIELNLRSLVGGFSADQQRISTKFLDNLFTHLVGGEKSGEWRPCISCSAQHRCGAWRTAQLLGASQDRSIQAYGALLRERLTIALQMVHQRNEVHITTRELKAALSYILFGTHYCTDLHNDTNLVPESYWDLAFDPDSPLRQGEVLRELARLDPSLEAHPRIDRYLLSYGGAAPEHGAPRYPELTVKSARRRAYFEWSDTQIAAIGGSPYAFGLARGQHFRSFRDFPSLPNEVRDQICREVCTGLSRLEDVPTVALRRTAVVPIRVVPRTPTETAFWVEKQLDRFHLVPEEFATLTGFETLHRHLVLTYTSDDRTERLIIPLELFTLLMDLKNGAQLLDVLSDDVFANLGVFTQRLAQENERRLLAWNPLNEDGVHEIGIWPSEAGQLIRVNTLTT